MGVGGFPQLLIERLSAPLGGSTWSEHKCHPAKHKFRKPISALARDFQNQATKPADPPGRALAALTAALSVAVALPAETTLARRQRADRFYLKPAPDAPAELQGLESILLGVTIGGNLGLFPENTSAEDAQVFIQYNSEDGIAFYARNTAVQVYIAPTHAEPTYMAKIGNPNPEPESEWILHDDFTIDTEIVGGTSIEHFAHAGQYKDKWLACNDGGIYTIYFGGEQTDNRLRFDIVIVPFMDGNV